MKETHQRSIFKAISYRGCAAIVTTCIVYIFTKRLILSLGVGLAELIAKIIFFYIHERVWDKISWGKPKHPLADISVKKPLTPEDKKKLEEQLKSLGYM